MSNNNEVRKVIEFHHKKREECWVGNKLHCLNQPAIRWNNGDEEWYFNGLLHRNDNQPAVIKKGIRKEWWKNGKLHQDNAPAIIWDNGRQEWYSHGVKHRSNAPAIIYDFGGVEWWDNGVLHRLDGPAVIDHQGTQIWYYFGQIHRDNGPAIVYTNGSNEWWINGHKIKNNIIMCPICRQINTSSTPYISTEQCTVCWINNITVQLDQCGHHCLCQSCYGNLNENT